MSSHATCETCVWWRDLYRAGNFGLCRINRIPYPSPDDCCSKHTPKGVGEDHE